AITRSLGLPLVALPSGPSAQVATTACSALPLPWQRTAQSCELSAQAWACHSSQKPPFQTVGMHLLLRGWSRGRRTTVAWVRDGSPKPALQAKVTTNSPVERLATCTCTLPSLKGAIPSSTKVLPNPSLWFIDRSVNASHTIPVCG